MAVPASAPPDMESRVSIYVLGVIGLVAVLVGVGFAYAVDAASRHAKTPSHRWDNTTTLTRTVGGRNLSIPLAWFRSAEDTDENFSTRVELVVRLPLGTNGAAREVDVTLVPRSAVRASSHLLDGVYLHKFGAEEVFGPSGLIGKPLRANDGYATETVWYDPITASPFVAKCDAPGGQADRGTCLRVVYLGTGLAAIYRFPVDALQGWRHFDAKLSALLHQVGATDS